MANKVVQFLYSFRMFRIGNSMISSEIFEENKTSTSEFFKTLKIARVRWTGAIWSLRKTHEWVCFLKLHEKLCYYLLIIYMTKLCRTDSCACVTHKIIYSLNCQYYNNVQFSFNRTVLHLFCTVLHRPIM